jgi:hypothetical protein
MSKQRSKKFWITFWSISIVLLVGFWFVLEVRNNPAGTLSSAIDYVPWLKNKQELKSIAVFADYLLRRDNREKTFLVLFQNNMELRPGGGFIGAFGILKVKNGEIKTLGTHDLSNFDGRIPSVVEPPYPMKETLNIDSWKLRDSNWSPDFSENAKKAEYFYHLGEGQEQFDGVVAINTDVLTSFLKITGPVKLPDYPGSYDSENAILQLEYQVEKGYAEQGIEKGERKSVMNELAGAIVEKVFELGNSQKLELAKMVFADLEKKDIQLYFKDEALQEESRRSGWAGEVKENWKKDYLMIVDANLGAYKSDYYMRRQIDYKINLSGETPKVNLRITYTHTGKVKDWMTRDYLSYLRVYVPNGAWLESSTLGDVRFGEEFGKKYFAGIVKVPLKETREVEMSYSLPKELDLRTYYNLLIQKQSGAGEVLVRVTVIDKNGTEKNYATDPEGDWLMKK